MRTNKRENQPELCAEIRKVYETREKGGNLRLSRKWGVSSSWISAIAAELGCDLMYHTYRHRKWTEKEEKILTDYADHTPGEVHRILRRHGYSRSIAAIKERRTRMRGRGLIPEYGMTRDHYTVTTLAEAMGVSKERVQRWINHKMLKARPIKEKDALKPRQYRIEATAVHRFLVIYINHWEMTRENKVWLVSMLTYGQDSIVLRDEKVGIAHETAGGIEEHCAQL